MNEKLFVRISAHLLFDPGLSSPEKILLALAGAFSESGGLKLDNTTLGKILGLNQSTVSRLIRRLQGAGKVEISGEKSRFRRIFIAQAGGDPGGRAAADRGDAYPGTTGSGGKIDDEQVRAMMRSIGLG